MKWMKEAISGQNLYLKLAIFITGIATGFDSSLRQLLAQIALFMVFLLLEPKLYCRLLSAFRRILPFFAGYWVFATLFAQSFPASILFSVQIIYLLLVTVAVFGELKMNFVASDSQSLRRYSWINSLFFFSFATWLYVQSFFHHYRLCHAAYASEPLSRVIEEVVSAVSAETEAIRLQVRELLEYRKVDSHLLSSANVTGLLFLVLLTVVNGV
ncbi:MAG: hypothetical protein CVU50_02790 [Candidatus Cloacimonetes bacterium HGW-Cloacimonetes-3]|jgi:hypothetical protein|nr:MAG: hypothetical protein CVU50_02790 [Candidatus Cloacimonetes bacterium HGW-Cloacimonetes-3]